MFQVKLCAVQSKISILSTINIMESTEGSYKIVATREKRGIYFTAIPYQWEKNKILFWPEHLIQSQREKLRQNGKSAPENSWKTYECILKCGNIATFDEAIKMEKQLTKCVDSEAEEELFNITNQSKSSLETNYNQYIRVLSTEVKQPENRISVITPNLQESTELQKNGLLQQDNILLEDSYLHGGCLIFDNEEDQTITKETDDNDVLDSLRKDILTIKNDLSEFKNQTLNKLDELKDQYIKINVYLDHIAANLTTSNSNKNTDEKQKKNEFMEKIKLPLRSVEELQGLEDELKLNPGFAEEVLNFFVQICGTSGDENGVKVGYKICDLIFAPSLLTEFSWTGVSRGKDVEKKPFNQFKLIIHLFFKIINSADSRFTLEKTKSFFKDNLLKHAKKRNERKRLICNRSPDRSLNDERSNDGSSTSVIPETDSDY